GFLWGWVEFWIIRTASIAALATVFTEALHDVLRNEEFQKAFGLSLGDPVLGFWPKRLVTVAVILGLAWVNVRGVRWGGLVQLFIGLVKVGALLAILALPFVAVYFSRPGATVNGPEPANLRPIWPTKASELNWNLVKGFASALLGVLWAYHGWMNIAPVAEE